MKAIDIIIKAQCPFTFVKGTKNLCKDYNENVLVPVEICKKCWEQEVEE